MDDATAQTTPFELTTKMMEFAVSKGSQVIKGKVENIKMSSSEEGKVEGVVVDGKVVASMKRQAKEGEFRSNIHRGGSASLIRITPEERTTAVRAATTMGLNVCGVDILRSAHGPLVMEVNSSPGLEGIENATGKDVAGLIIQFMEKNAKRGKTKTRGKG